CIRDYIHVTDLADAHVRAIDYLRQHQDNIRLNLGNGRGYSVLEIVAAVEKVTGRDVNCVISPRRVGDPAILIGSAKKAKEVIGWQPKFTLEKIIETAWKWHLKKFGGAQ